MDINIKECWYESAMQLQFHGKLGQCIFVIKVCVSMLVDAINIHIFTNNTQISWNHKYLGKITSFGDNTSVQKRHL